MREFAQGIAEKAKKGSAGKNASVIALAGELGAGKTFFVKAFAESFGLKRNMPSPTFLIVRNYPLKNGLAYERFFHLDLYRLEKEAELSAVGFREIIENPKHIVLIEWADRFPQLIPKDAVWIHIEHGTEKTERHVAIKKAK